MTSAERLFLEKGVEQTTIEDITAGAAISKGAFYLHFGSKADVVQALRSRFVQGVLDRIVGAVAECSQVDPDARLQAWARACATAYLEATRLHDLIFSALPLPPREGLARNILTDHLEGLLRDGNVKGAWSLADPHFTAVFLFAALHGVVEGRTSEAGEARETLLDAIETHFRRAVR
ncbi:TetR/AcrR family transcriptional regulator [Mangrovicella endophytica]|uniref:TetR/AcrR family transcriptional regulator n=1 Tax=Mangrovicella endophytica TaxID=2066697 RepID=UPI000C9E32E4|nr:TetR/AcrR family transcriptional regulator [Mangrovicella endophytica]